MQTLHLLVKTHLFEIKIGHLRDLCRKSNEKVFLVMGMGSFYSTISFELQNCNVFAALSIVANHRHLC